MSKVLAFGLMSHRVKIKTTRQTATAAQVDLVACLGMVAMKDSKLVESEGTPTAVVAGTYAKALFLVHRLAEMREIENGHVAGVIPNGL